MSLIVLSSKGDDPEDFSNYMTQGIKIPKDAEVCLVSSHINRKLMMPTEIHVAAGSNTLSLSYGSASESRDGLGYTPHGPVMLSLSLKSKLFPIKVKSFETIKVLMNDFMNDSINIPISTLTNGAWISDIDATSRKYEFKCAQRKPSDAGSLGSSVAANFRVRAGINDGSVLPFALNNYPPINLLEFGEGANIEQSTEVGRTNYVKLVKSENQGNFIDTEPVWNTDTEETVGTWTATADNLGVQGGCWTWDVSAAGIASEEDVVGMRGGIVGGNKFDFNAASNNYNILLDPQTGGTDYDIWWEISSRTAANSITVDFYYRKDIGSGNEKHSSPVDTRVVRFGTQRKLVGAGTELRIVMRPCALNRTNPATFKYVVEVGLGTITSADGTIVSIDPANQQGLPGYVQITDPLSLTLTDFNLYRHLPLRQGTSFSWQNLNAVEVQQCAIHHKLNETVVFARPDAGLPIIIGTAPLNNTQVDIVKPDTFLFEALSESTIGSSIGFPDGFHESVMNLMQTVGLIADVNIESSVPTTHTLVVQLPDLSITGFYGNTSGSAASGTLNVNGGGNSAPILGTIPFGKPSRIVNLGGDDAGYMQMNKGQFFAAPMENWIRLNNPNSLVLSSLRCRLTDELGNKPSILDPNTTITIKVRERADRRNVIQGGTAARPDEMR